VFFLDDRGSEPQVVPLNGVQGGVTLEVGVVRKTPVVLPLHTTRASDGLPAKLFPLTSTLTDRLGLAAPPTEVAPTCRPEWNTQISQWRYGVPGDATVKLTCSAGMPWSEICGLYGSNVAVTEVTCTLRLPGGSFGFAAGVVVHPSASTALPANTKNTDHDDFIVISMVDGPEVIHTATVPVGGT
jgi:hypothetical protein